MKKILLLSALSLSFLFSCQDGKKRITFVVDSPAPYNQAKDTIYVAGNFNNWNPKDSSSFLTMQDGNKFGGKILLPEGFADSLIEYKYTHGSWATVETSKEGGMKPNRKLPYKGRSVTAFDLIASWQNQKQTSTASPQVTLWKEAIEMPELKRNRKIWVYLPSDYAQTDKHYPVIYLQDGQNLFDNAIAPFGEWNVDETMLKVAQETDFQSIVVGIAHGDSLRTKEYAAYKNAKYDGGEGWQYLAFVVNTLKPQIDSTFRTLPKREYTTIGGSSLGGLISFQAATKHSEVFSKFLLFSPSFWYNQEVFTDAPKIAKSGEKINIYMLAGGKEGKEMELDVRKMLSMLEGYKNVSVTFNFVPEGEHNEAFWSSELPQALQWLEAQK